MQVTSSGRLYKSYKHDILLLSWIPQDLFEVSSSKLQSSQMSGYCNCDADNARACRLGGKTWPPAQGWDTPAVNSLNLQNCGFIMAERWSAQRRITLSFWRESRNSAEFTSFACKSVSTVWLDASVWCNVVSPSCLSIASLCTRPQFREQTEAISSQAFLHGSTYKYRGLLQRRCKSLPKKDVSWLSQVGSTCKVDASSNQKILRHQGWEQRCRQMYRLWQIFRMYKRSLSKLQAQA